ncbi:hypothetical protein FJR45_02230 [Sulfurimonas sediminis]|uniref:Uncharacterized protein n=1 Tax=Sulfurimonas sediminis TaxID=2590020 RepID=A0A7M1AZA5_9BACT|nr:hypothetical protein [Sulfurimonas sediminis]QOP42829.1 hypothetical protein FJR45_02230 [Sulfurimonas sediminis]
MHISREIVLLILKYLDKNPNFYFPFKIICKNFNEDDKLFNVNCLDIETDYIESNKLLNDFLLIGNFQNLDYGTTTLIAQVFIDNIINMNAFNEILSLALEYRRSWKEDLYESENIEEYGIYEFIGGKAEAYEECAQIMKNTYWVNK